MLIIFDGHFFYSGANQWVLINGALIALLFSAAYNFWEAGLGKREHHFLLGIIFLSQLPANKYQMIYVFIFMGVLAALCQRDLLSKIKSISLKKFWFILAAFLLLPYGMLKMLLLPPILYFRFLPINLMCLVGTRRW